MLRQSLRLFDGLAMVVGIMIGSGIFRTPGLVARQLGRPWLTFVAWLLGGVLAFAGALCFAELATRHPKAGGKYVYAREAFGRRIGFVVGWCEGFAMYPAAIAALGVVTGEFIGRLAGWPHGVSKWVGVAAVALLVAINMTGVTSGRWVQNVATSAKVLALSAVVVMAFAAGHGEGWHGTLAGAPTGLALFGALAIAFQSVIWSYYGYGDAAKIAEEVVDPGRTLPRVFLFGIAIATGLYLLLNAAFLHVLPFNRLATSVLVAGDVAATIFGPHGNLAITVLALLVVLASLNGNIFVTPRVIFGLAREGTGPARARRGERGRDAVRGDVVGGRGGGDARRDGHVRAAVGDGDRAGADSGQCGVRGAVSAAGPPARRPVSRAALPRRTGGAHSGVPGAARGNGDDAAGTRGDRGGSAGRGVGTELGCDSSG